MTNNVSEGWNSNWNKSCQMNASLWSTIQHFKKEDSTAHQVLIKY